jgi:hypothetical protein
MMILSYLDALEKVHQQHKAQQQATAPAPVGD